MSALTTPTTLTAVYPRSRWPAGPPVRRPVSLADRNGPRWTSGRDELDRRPHRSRSRATRAAGAAARSPRSRTSDPILRPRSRRSVGRVSL